MHCEVINYFDHPGKDYARVRFSNGTQVHVMMSKFKDSWTTQLEDLMTLHSEDGVCTLTKVGDSYEFTSEDCCEDLFGMTILLTQEETKELIENLAQWRAKF